MPDRSYRPALARRILSSERDNGDLLSDLTRLAWLLAVENGREVSEDEARSIDADYGLQFDLDGWATPAISGTDS